METLISNKEKYDAVFIECFGVSAEQLNEKFVYQCVPSWDSVGHMGMIAALEDAFSIMMETEDIIEFGSYTIGVEKLKKYGIDVTS
jgi:acyl carrier protein